MTYRNNVEEEIQESYVPQQLIARLLNKSEKEYFKKKAVAEEISKKVENIQSKLHLQYREGCAQYLNKVIIPKLCENFFKDKENHNDTSSLESILTDNCLGIWYNRWKIFPTYDRIPYKIMEQVIDEQFPDLEHRIVSNIYFEIKFKKEIDELYTKT